MAVAVTIAAIPALGIAGAPAASALPQPLTDNGDWICDTTASHKAGFGVRACIRSNLTYFSKTRQVQSRIIIWNENSNPSIDRGEYWAVMREKSSSGRWVRDEGGWENPFWVKHRTTQSISTFAAKDPVARDTCYRVVANIKVYTYNGPTTWSYTSEAETCDDVSGED